MARDLHCPTCGCFPVKLEDTNLAGSELLFAFAAWLTTRPQEVVASAHHDAAPWAALVRDFCNHHELPAPRDGWENLIKPMKAA